MTPGELLIIILFVCLGLPLLFEGVFTLYNWIFCDEISFVDEMHEFNKGLEERIKGEDDDGAT